MQTTNHIRNVENLAKGVAEGQDVQFCKKMRIIACLYIKLD